ncbi:MAG TPA: class I SAM-dependent methyltransferase, partial [Niabella sp.]
STLEELVGNKLTFNFINSYLVLEHILDPLEFIKSASSMLEDDGLLTIVVPNDFSVLQKINMHFHKKEWWISLLEHLNYFNKKSLNALFRKAGLEVVYETVTFPIDIFLLMGKDYLSEPSLGKECHAMRKTFEYKLFEAGASSFKEELYKAFSYLGIGRELLITGRKMK